ncbi:hypothetical protein ABIA32_003180 [Streptacidiphilus sp. MAP12-20]|uniref:SAF domain-containing protein n=1 Tax=Streptacidiphilus sp. MAP12-20 TaxID=3156299 RepID=UPI003514BC73
MRTPQRRRRRPAVLALGIALVAAGGLGGATLYVTTGQRVAVLALAHDVPAGQAITAADLTEVQISLDPAVKPLSANSHVLNMRAAADLKAGQLLTAGDLTNDPLVGPGDTVVPIAAKQSQFPAEGTRAGAWVVLVYTPSAQGNGGAAAAPAPSAAAGSVTVSSLVARVVDVGPVSQTDQTVVIDLAIPTAKAAAVADLAASGKFMLLLAAPGSQSGGG